MKKNRPAYLLRVICAESEIPVMEEIVFRNTTTIGIRRYPVERTTLSRENITLQLACGEVAVKKCTCGNRIFCYPEYESVRLLAERSGLEFAALYEAARNAAEQS